MGNKRRNLGDTQPMQPVNPQRAERAERRTQRGQKNYREAYERELEYRRAVSRTPAPQNRSGQRSRSRQQESSLSAIIQQMRKKKKKDKKKKKQEKEEINIVKDLISLALYILAIVAVCWLILTYVGQRTEVSGDSMNDTLHNGDSLWIDKLSYHFKDPERFDIVVFPYEEEDDTYYIKRIIGLPGETVYIDEDGVIYINDEPLEEDYGKEVIEENHRGLAAEPVTLGADEYFVMGDNRNNSRDSRLSDVGNIHKNKFVGKAVFRFTGGFGFLNKEEQ